MGTVIQQDIRIRYENNSDIPDPEFKVVVFTKAGGNGNNDNVTAWKLLQAQSEADFAYPVLVEVAADHPGGGATQKAGPFPAHLAETWAITQATEKSTPLLTVVDSVNPPNTIIVKNTKPTGFDGNPYNIQLIKDGSPLVTVPNVKPDSQAVIQLTPTIYFGIVKDVQYGAIFNSLTDSQYNTPFQLLHYQGGLVVTLSHNFSTGGFSFEGAPMRA